MQPTPPARPASRFPVNPRVAVGVVALAGVGVYVYTKRKNAAASSTSTTAAAGMSGEAPPDNTYEQQSSATAEFGQQTGEIANLGNSAAAAQAAATTAQSGVDTLYGADVNLSQGQSAQGTRIANDEKALAAESKQIAIMQKEIAALQPKPKAKPKAPAKPKPK